MFREHHRIQDGSLGFSSCRKQVHLDGVQLSHKELILISTLPNRRLWQVDDRAGGLKGWSAKMGRRRASYANGEKTRPQGPVEMVWICAVQSFPSSFLLSPLYLESKSAQHLHMKINDEDDERLWGDEHMVSHVVFQLASKVPEEKCEVLDLELTDLYPNCSLFFGHQFGFPLLQASADGGLPCQRGPQEHGLDPLVLLSQTMLKLAEVISDLPNATSTHFTGRLPERVPTGLEHFQGLSLEELPGELAKGIVLHMELL